VAKFDIEYAKFSFNAGPSNIQLLELDQYSDVWKSL